MLIKDIQPNASLAEYVRKYQIIRWQFEETINPPDKFLGPRPEHSLTFYIRDLQTYSFSGSQKKENYPRSIVCGIHTNTLIRGCGHDFWAIKIIFQPCALFKLTKVPMSELVNNFADAEAMFGKEVSLLYERLNGTENLPEMIGQIELFFKNIISQKTKESLAVDWVCKQILTQNQSQNLDNLARQSCLSTRQFIRKFDERIGINPKLFDRIVRFDRAYRLKNNSPSLDWLSVALSSGYYDYQHLTRDYKDFTNLSPVAYYEIDQKAPERTFGLHFG
jgi:AraC-like DNA-binding protein